VRFRRHLNVVLATELDGEIYLSGHPTLAGKATFGLKLCTSLSEPLGALLISDCESQQNLDSSCWAQSRAGCNLEPVDLFVVHHEEVKSKACSPFGITECSGAQCITQVSFAYAGALVLYKYKATARRCGTM
jgi:hypothetical protein